MEGKMQATIYIRKENEQKWLDIADKSNWINSLLQNSDSTKEYGAVRETPVGPMVTVLSEELKTCKHGYSPELCKFAGLKKCKAV